MKDFFARVGFRPTSGEPESRPLNWTVRARFNVCSYQLPEIDLTPVLGLAFLATVFALVAGTTWN